MVFNEIPTFLIVVKIELCGELLVVLAPPRFSCTADFFPGLPDYPAVA